MDSYLYEVGELKGGKQLPQEEGQKKLSIYCSVGPYKCTTQNQNEDAIGLIRRILASHPDLDLFVAPEHSFWVQKEERDGKYYHSELPALRIAKDGSGKYSIQKLDDSQLTEELSGYISSLMKLAKDYGTNLVIGTVPLTTEEYAPEKSDITNTMVVIGKDGEIAAVRYKVWGSESLGERDVTGTYEEYALKTAFPIKLESRSREEFTILPFICADFGDPRIMEQNGGKNVDVVVYSGINGDDILAGGMATYLQTGTKLPDNYQTVAANSYDKFAVQEIIKKGGIFAVSHPDVRGCGVFYSPFLGYATDYANREPIEQGGMPKMAGAYPVIDGMHAVARISGNPNLEKNTEPGKEYLPGLKEQLDLREHILMPYPNPAHERVYFNYLGEVVAKLYDINGNELGNWRFAASMEEARVGEIDVSKLSQGAYLLEFQSGGSFPRRMNTQKFVKL